MSSPLSLPSSPSIVRAPEPPQPTPPNRAFSRKGARSTLGTALELAPTFPFGVVASQVCPYCYNTGYSSPGTTVQLLSNQTEMRLA